MDKVVRPGRDLAEVNQQAFHQLLDALLRVEGDQSRQVRGPLGFLHALLVHDVVEFLPEEVADGVRILNGFRAEVRHHLPGGVLRDMESGVESEYSHCSGFGHFTEHLRAGRPLRRVGDNRKIVPCGGNEDEAAQPAMTYVGTLPRSGNGSSGLRTTLNSK